MDMYPTWSENGRMLAFSSTRTSSTPRGSSTYSDIWYVFLRENDQELTYKERKDLWEEEAKDSKKEKESWVDIEMMKFRI